MNTMNMTIGDLFYRLVVGRDPPWNNDSNVVPHRIHRRPENILEWFHACNPLHIRFCRCGALHEITWSYRYVTRHLYPKGTAFTIGACAECTKLSTMFHRLHNINEDKFMNPRT